MKTCRVCNETQDIESFYKANETLRRTECKKCTGEMRRKHKFGLDHGGYQKLLEGQDSRCGVCAIHVSDYSQRYKHFAVDHDHSTGKIRGLLCHNCNRALGMFQDDVTFLENAIEYLNR